MAWYLMKHGDKFTFTFLILTAILGKDLYYETLGYGLDDRGSRVRFPAGAANFSLHRV
jgi:hypothetical protein